MVFDPKHQENEVDLIQVIQETSQVKEPLTVETLEAFLKTMPKEDIYRIKGFIRTADNTLYILNHAFGRHTLTPVEHSETLEGTQSIQVKVTVMGQGLRMYQEKVKQGLLKGGADGEVTLTAAHRH